MRKRYIRFGEIPKKEQSSIYYHGEFIGYENGVSVYNTTYFNKSWVVILPLKVNKDTISTYECIRVYQKCKVYLVTGKKIGTGKDGEPLICISVLKDITNLYY